MVIMTSSLEYCCINISELLLIRYSYYLYAALILDVVMFLTIVNIKTTKIGMYSNKNKVLL